MSYHHGQSLTIYDADSSLPILKLRDPFARELCGSHQRGKNAVRCGISNSIKSTSRGQLHHGFRALRFHRNYVQFNCEGPSLDHFTGAPSSTCRATVRNGGYTKGLAMGRGMNKGECPWGWFGGMACSWP